MDKSAQIKTIKAKIALLDEEKEQLIKELCNIEKETIHSTDSLPAPAIFKNPSSQHISLDKKLEFTQEQQIKLFRSLFRGRDDVYARLWVSRKTGKSGYSPVCKNEWVTKICQKPVMKCSHCPNRELMPLDDEVIRRYLSGASYGYAISQRWTSADYSHAMWTRLLSKEADRNYPANI